MTNQHPTPGGHRDRWVSLGLTVSAGAALVSSFSGLRSLALLAGWAMGLAFLLPVTIDAYAMTATRVWLADSTRSLRARRFARSNAVGAILLSLAGNATDHLITAGLLPVTWIIVLGVGAVPPTVLGLVSHLAVLRQQADEVVPTPETPPAVPATPLVLTTVVPSAVPSTEAPHVSTADIGTTPPTRTAATSSTRPARDSRTEYVNDELLAAARRLDTAWRTAHDGRRVSRDTLRRELHISAARASAVLRQLRSEDSNKAISPPMNRLETHPE